VFSALTAAVGAADKVIELMRREPLLPPAGALAPPALEGRIELRNVRFSYPARPRHEVLKGLSLRVEPGEVIALVGPSGGGKSSVIKLLQRFYEPSAGEVLLDGRPVGAYDPKWLVRGGGRGVVVCSHKRFSKELHLYLRTHTYISHSKPTLNHKNKFNSAAAWRSSARSRCCSRARSAATFCTASRPTTPPARRRPTPT
jgi:energy-coupling factor transporter ATP-binding protein EcfA2